MLENIPSMPGVNRSCLPWIICGLFLALLLFFAMKWSLEEGKKFVPSIDKATDPDRVLRKKPEPKKQVEKKEGHGQW